MVISYLRRRIPPSPADGFGADRTVGDCVPFSRSNTSISSRIVSLQHSAISIYFARVKNVTRNGGTVILYQHSFGHIPALASIVLLVCTLGNGCVWRGATADQYIGPLLFNTERFPTRAASIDEQVHFPALIEWGQQWGISVGIVRRVIASPRVIDASQPVIRRSTIEASRPFFSIPITKNLSLSPFYLRIEHKPSPEFRIRSLVGFQGSVGAEGNFLSVGLATTREFIPRHGGPYLLCHDSRAPLETTFVVYKNSTGFTSTPC
jgi:hypothetical protein